MGKEGVRYLTWSVPLLHALMTLVDFVDMLDLEQVCLREERVQVLHVGVRGRGVLGRSPRQRLDGDGRGAEAVLLHLEIAHTHTGSYLCRQHAVRGASRLGDAPRAAAHRCAAA